MQRHPIKVSTQLKFQGIIRFIRNFSGRWRLLEMASGC